MGLPDYPPTSPHYQLEIATTTIANNGDSVIIPGNSLGDGVITVTPGKLLNVGPQRIEVDNPVFPGNSGSPIFHVPSGKVIGILTEARTMEKKKLDRVSMNSIEKTDSQIKGDTRYFGHRIDTVTEWGAFDWTRYQTLSKFLADAEKEISAIESFVYNIDDTYENWLSFRSAGRNRPGNASRH